MSKMELLGVSEAKNLTKQKWKQYCGTPCILKVFLESLDHIFLRKIFDISKVCEKQVGPTSESNSIIKCILICGLEFYIQNFP